MGGSSSSSSIQKWNINHTRTQCMVGEGPLVLVLYRSGRYTLTHCMVAGGGGTSSFRSGRYTCTHTVVARGPTVLYKGYMYTFLFLDSHTFTQMS